jgi:hypothetical protein
MFYVHIDIFKKLKYFMFRYLIKAFYCNYRVQSTLYRTKHAVPYKAHCTVQSTLYRTKHTVPYKAHCIVQSTLYRTKHAVPYKARCTVQSTLYRTKHAVPYRNCMYSRLTVDELSVSKYVEDIIN